MNKVDIMKAIKPDIKLVFHGDNYYLLDESLRKKTNFIYKNHLIFIFAMGKSCVMC